MKIGTGFFYEKSLCYSYVLFIFNNTNHKIPLQISIKVAFIHTWKKNRWVKKEKIKLDTRIILNHCSSTSKIFSKVWFSTYVHHERTCIFKF